MVNLRYKLLITSKEQNVAIRELPLSSNNDNSMRLLLLVIVAVLFFIGGKAFRCQAQDEITIGVSTGYPPYYYKKNGELEGVCIDLVNRVAKDLGVKIQYQEYPWKRLLGYAEKGLVDAIMPLFRTEEREEFLYFDNLEIAREMNSFFALKNRNIEFNGRYENLHGYKIGVVAEYSYGKMFDDYSEFDKVVTLNEQHLIQMFKHARFDVGIGNKSVISFYAKEENLMDEIIFFLPPVTDDPLYLGFSKKRGKADLHLKFSIVLRKFKQTKEYTELLKKYNIQQPEKNHE